MFFKTTFSLIKQTFQNYSADNAARLAAALAYYTIFSIAPLLVLVIAILGLVLGSNQNVQQQIISQIGNMVGPSAASTIQGMVAHQLNNTSSNIIATVLGIIIVILGATGVFGALQGSLNTIWGVTVRKGAGIWGLVRNRVFSFAMIVVISFILLVSLVISAVLASIGTAVRGSLPGSNALWDIINFVVSLAIITIIFAMIFRYLPDVEIDWSDVWIGALITAILFNIGKFLIGLYLGRSSVTSAYGAAGSLVVLLIWIYYSAQILFIGAEFTQVWARHRGKDIQPNKIARLMVGEERADQGLQPKDTHAVRPSTAPRRAGPVQEKMIPVTAQPPLRDEDYDLPREQVRYEPPNPAVVIPVIALGAAAGVAAVAKVAMKVVRTVRG